MGAKLKLARDGVPRVTRTEWPTALALGSAFSVAFLAPFLATGLARRVAELVEALTAVPPFALLAIGWACTVACCEQWLEGRAPGESRRACVLRAAAWGAVNGGAIVAIPMLAGLALKGIVALVLFPYGAPIAFVVGSAAGALLGAIALSVPPVARRLAPTVRTGP